MFINNAFAQAAQNIPAQGSIGATVLQLVAIFAIFYFILIRPQQKKIKEHDAKIAAIKKGDTILTGGGIYATVVDASDPTDLRVQIAEDVFVLVNRLTVRDVVLEKNPVEKNNKNKKSK